MEPQTLLNIVFGAMGALSGWVLNRLWGSVDNLHTQDEALCNKVQKIEVLVAGQYVKRTEQDYMATRLFQRLDRIEAKLDAKADKCDCPRPII